MPLEQELSDLLKQAMKDKDARTANVVRMLKTRVMERRTAKGFHGTVDDALVQDVIGQYRKQMKTALAEFESAGPQGAERAEELRFEIAFCDRFLPTMMDEGALRTLLGERIGALGLRSVKEVGRLVGDVMKTHKGKVDAAEVKRIAEELLPKA